MNIEHKIREFLRTQDDPVTVQQIGEGIGHENSASLGVMLYKMIGHNQGVGRMKIKDGKRLVYGYFSTDKDAPATSKTAETLNLSSKPVEKQEAKQLVHEETKPAEVATEPKDIPPVIPEIRHTPEPTRPEGDYFFIGYANGLTQEDQNGKTREFGNMELASAEASRIASHAPGMLVEIWHAYPAKKIRARVEIEEVS